MLCVATSFFMDDTFLLQSLMPAEKKFSSVSLFEGALRVPVLWNIIPLGPFPPSREGRFSGQLN